MAKESMEQMIERLNDGIPGKHWIQTSVGLVNMRNHGAAMEAGARLAKLKAEKANDTAIGNKV